MKYNQKLIAVEQTENSITLTFYNTRTTGQWNFTISKENIQSFKDILLQSLKDGEN